jgi:hypothetical protein
MGGDVHVAEKRMNSLQDWLLRLLLRQGPSVLVASMYWELGMLTMGLQVWREMLSKIWFIRDLPDGSQAKPV